MYFVLIVLTVLTLFGVGVLLGIYHHAKDLREGNDPLDDGEALLAILFMGVIFAFIGLVASSSVCLVMEMASR